MRFFRNGFRLSPTACKELLFEFGEGKLQVLDSGSDYLDIENYS